MLQVGDAIQFLHSLGWLHASLSSHSVQLVNPTMAKLAQLEHLTREEGEIQRDCSQSRVSSKNAKNIPHDPATLPWVAPEVLGGGRASKAGDVYSLCCVLWEASTSKVPWYGIASHTILTVMPDEGPALRPTPGCLPQEVEALLARGLQVQVKARDLSVAELRQALARVRKGGGEEHGRERVKSCPTRSLSSSAIQFNHAKFFKKLNTEQRQLTSLHSSSDYSFVSNQAKRDFLRSQPASPCRPGLGPRSRTSLFYDAFSLSSGLDFSSDSSREGREGESSDSSSSSLSPTSGYSSYDLLDSVNCSEVTATCEGGRTFGPKRSRSVPRIARARAQDYVTGIKPASHRLESHASSCSVSSPATQQSRSPSSSLTSYQS